MVNSYRDTPGLTNRANSAMIRIDNIIARTELPSGVRLVLIAEVMASEPVLTDRSTAAFGARQGAIRFKNRPGTAPRTVPISEQKEDRIA